MEKEKKQGHTAEKAPLGVAGVHPLGNPPRRPVQCAPDHSYSGIPCPLERGALGVGAPLQETRSPIHPCSTGPRLHTSGNG